jgi:diguanylate cyclase (GGDEF)-like protein
VLLLIVTLLVEPGDPGHQIYGVIFPMAGLIAIALLSIALMRSDVDHRTESVIDGLTGLLNRRALGHRLQELQAQAALTGNPVAVIAGDIDRFKTINDVHGHAMGDAVLVDVAYRLRKELRAFDLAYRIGGEEFLILLPGATIDDATDIAEELRARISEEPVCGLDVTISFGVSGSIDGTFDRDDRRGRRRPLQGQGRRARPGGERRPGAGARGLIAYGICRPVIAREITRRWISDVPSKIV